MRKLRMLSLFAGIGGLDLGAEWTDGIETIGFVENEPFCREVLKKHWPDTPQWGDIHVFTRESLVAAGIDPDSIDIIAGGFPCQGNSVAGQRRGRQDERNLWPEYARLIREIRPRWVVGENVPGLLNADVDERTGDHGLFGDIL